jgi:hypothetical protein
MQVYGAIILGSLLVTGFSNNSLSVRYEANNSRHLTLSQQQTFAPVLSQENECSSNEHSPMPGCGRRDN